MTDKVFYCNIPKSYALYDQLKHYNGKKINEKCLMSTFFHFPLEWFDPFGQFEKISRVKLISEFIKYIKATENEKSNIVKRAEFLKLRYKIKLFYAGSGEIWEL